MMDDLIVEDKNGIRYITLNRPKALNALNAALIREIGAQVEETRNDKTIVGIIITGEGEKAFAAGADIKGFPSLSKEDGVKLSKEGHEIFNKIEGFSKPVIAAVNGYALGGGLELAMACHMRVACNDAVFGMPEVKLGLIPGYGGTQRLAGLVGKAKAMEFILTADMIPAEEALSLGLVNHVTEKGEEVAKAESIIMKVSKRGPQAVAEAIKNINLSSEGGTKGYESEIESFSRLMVSEECKEGVSAFLEKRKPKFRK